MFLEDELFDERAICAAIFKNSAEAILIADQKGKIVHVNPAVLKLFQYSFYELITQPVHILVPDQFKKQHPQNVEKYNKNPRTRAMGAGKTLSGRRKDGSTFPLSISLSPAKVGESQLVVALIIDTSEIHRHQEELNKLNGELETKVKLRTQELASSIQELEKKNVKLKIAEEEMQVALKKEKELNDLKSRFVSMASHEFRTPLGTILSSLTLVEKYDEKGMQDKKWKHYDRIRSNVKNLTEILNDFLNLDKLQSGAIRVSPSSFDLKELIIEIINDFETQLKPGQSIKLEFTGSKELVTDKNLLRNALINLLSNASKYSNENDAIEIIVQQDKNTRIEFKDYGIGIPEEDKKHMFERFFRAQNAINLQGTGLGLTIVKRYLELLEGELSFESVENKGTSFYLTLNEKS